MVETEQYYRILELEPGASPEEVHQGYLDLIWVWHPDRFVGHPRLQRKAHCKLQELNAAHDRLRSYRTTRQTINVNVHNPSKSQATPPPNNQSSTESLRQPKVSQPRDGDPKKTIKDCGQRISPRAYNVPEWLD